MEFEAARLALIQELAKNSSIRKSLATWMPRIRELLDYDAESKLSPQKVDALGSELRSIFFSTSPSGRTQSGVSSAGTSWEFLSTWYLNLQVIGLPIWVSQVKNGLVPQVLVETFTLSMGNWNSTSEPDLVMFAVPLERAEITPQIRNPRLKKNVELKNFISTSDKLIRERMNEISASIIQCKSNWNDNSQTVQLWGLIYDSSASRRALASLTVGSGGLMPSGFDRFTYAFFTAPTQKNLTGYKPGSTTVERLSSLSGGNYWGAATKPGVARSLNEFILRNYSDYLPSSSDRALLMETYRSHYDFFLNLDLRL